MKDLHPNLLPKNLLYFHGTPQNTQYTEYTFAVNLLEAVRQNLITDRVLTTVLYRGNEVIVNNEYICCKIGATGPARGRQTKLT